MISWWDVMKRLKPFDYGRDTASWNRAKVIGVIDTFSAIGDVYGEPFALHLMQNVSVAAVLGRLNQDDLSDDITLLEG